jgi:hypothetical protein
MSDPICEHGHEFVTGAELGFHRGGVLHDASVCRQCGVVRRRDGQNNPCVGKVRVELREGNHAPINGNPNEASND